MSPAAHPITCSDFDVDAAELSLGLLTDPRRASLVHHAGECGRCQARLDDLVAVGDRLVLLAPQVDPPAAFETRALARMGGPVADLRWARRARVLTAVAALVATLAVGMLLGRLVAAPSNAPGERTAVIRNMTGGQVGDVHLVRAPRPHVLVSVIRPPTTPGVRTCELQRADGSWTVVGTWSKEELGTGVWSVALDPVLLNATAMRVTNEDGALLATATFAH